MPDLSEPLQSWLSELLRETGGVAGTVHLHESGGLRLAAAINIPAPVQQAVEWVPSGKGMAGLALERGEAVQTCNLQEDRSGAVQPRAKAVNAQAGIAIPVRDVSGAIAGVVGVAFLGEREFQGEELARLENAASTLTCVIGS
ncbi:MAG TPA: GAF domain-containing protein [Bryobacteraceae bacterium]|nr:GAF domain-containing protein [Bryobacteraceae bacterium]